MRSFLKSFLASLLAIIVFAILLIIFAVAVISPSTKATIGEKAVLAIDLSQTYRDVEQFDVINRLTSVNKDEPPSLSQLIRVIKHAAKNDKVKGIYIKAEANGNDLGSSEELRNALQQFKASGKFLYAYGSTISMKAYFVANVADKIYTNPVGGLEWKGMSMQLPFVKGTLDRLELEPQIFYAGKFKSATEPLREKKMTEANRLQSAELLWDVYRHLLVTTAEVRNIDTAMLRKYADSNIVQFASAAVANNMLDGLRYDDEVKNEIRKTISIDTTSKINFVTPAKYIEAENIQPAGKQKIAVIYAEGDIVEGNGERGQIGGNTYMNYIRKARIDEDVKAIVFRINSGGGSALASELIWREVDLARQVKPVMVSFGDVAASGGYYIASAADSIFCQPNTITGSIGVFSLVINTQNFFNKKLGVTFDDVSTNDHAILSAVKPLTAFQKVFIQQEVDSIYHLFKQRVSNGRNLSMDYVDSIAQGRVYSGNRALDLRLADRIGGLNDAIAAAAQKAELSDYQLKEYPSAPNLLEMFISKTESSKTSALKKEIGEEGFKIYTSINKIKQSSGKVQAKMPFELIIE